MKKLHKKIMLIFGIFLLLLIAFGTFLFTHTPTEKYFSLDVSFNNTSFKDGEEAVIKVNLRHKSIGFYNAAFASDYIIISVYLEGEDEPFITQLKKQRFILPFSKINRDYFFTVNKDVNYIIKVYTKMTIKDKEINISNTYKIEKGILANSFKYLS